MSEMVERVARAIAHASDETAIDDIDRAIARAAIAAMREPTSAMVIAGLDNCYKADLGYTAMIDAALKEPTDA